MTPSLIVLAATVDSTGGAPDRADHRLGRPVRGRSVRGVVVRLHRLRGAGAGTGAR